MSQNSGGDDEEEEEEEGDLDEEATCKTQESVNDPPGLHQRVDQMHEASGTDFVVPYFPTALAVKDNPLEFNFDLRLLDTLSLPCRIDSREDMALVPSVGTRPAAEPIHFQSTAEAIAYCSEKLKAGWMQKSAEESSAHKRLSHPDLDKERLFGQEGKPLQHLLGSGIGELDANLQKVRLDR